MGFNFKNSNLVGTEDNTPEVRTVTRRTWEAKPSKLAGYVSMPIDYTLGIDLKPHLFTEVRKDLYQYCDICKGETSHATRWRGEIKHSLVCLNCGETIFLMK